MQFLEERAFVWRLTEAEDEIVRQALVAYLRTTQHPIANELLLLRGGAVLTVLSNGDSVISPLPVSQPLDAPLSAEAKARVDAEAQKMSQWTGSIAGHLGTDREADD